jgi:tetratricopeptide (TPR) repeat protein
MLPLATALGCALAAPSAPPLPVPAQLLRRGRPRTAITAANQVLRRDPDDADAMAWVAAGWVATGHPTDAAAAFALATGSAWYEDVGIDAHGDALRPVHPAAAAALHTERLRMGDIPDGRAIRLYLDIIDDHRIAGDAEAALDAASEALGRWPRAAAVQATLADLYMDLGDLDAAGAHLWQARRAGVVLRVHLAEGRLALLEGRPGDALMAARRAARGRSPSLRISALEAEALRQLGQPQEAADALAPSRTRNSDDPAVLAVLLRVNADLGADRENRAVAARAKLYPGHPVLGPLLHDLGLAN